MIVQAEHRDVHIDLAHALRDSWDDYAGIRPTRVRVISGEVAIEATFLSSIGTG